MRILNAICFDVRFQFRHGFYYAYLFISAVYILALLNITGEYRGYTTVAILFSDTTMLGFFFIGALILLEKGQNIHESIFVTPLRVSEYLVSKVVSLMLLSFISSFVIVGAVHYGNLKNVFIFAAGLALSSSLYTLFGLAFSSKSHSVNDYFAKALGTGIFISLPILSFFNFYDTVLFYLFPTKASLILIDILFRDYAAGEIIYAFLCLIIWIFIAAYYAGKTFYKNIILKNN